MTKSLPVRIIICAALGTVLLCGAMPCRVVSANEQREYGEYLSGECTGCHRAGADDGAIPPIIGLEPERFIAALKEFRQEVRTNPAMVSVAKSLDDEQIAALAAYFFSLKVAAEDE